MSLSFALIGAPNEPQVSADELPRVAPIEASAALKSFVVKPGFRLELAASEPLVVDPVALAFDESGRLFVIEMRDYSERRDERMGRVRLLTDTNYDGRFDTSTIYADGLGWPTAVICYDGGVFVGCTPDILYFKDTDNDGVADERKLVFTGFGAGQERLNVQGMLNSFNWGLDNRIHGATGLNGGRIKSTASPDAKPVELRGKDFSFDPRDLKTIRPESGGGQHGLSFDNYGGKFVCHNSRHIMQVMYEDYYGGRNPHYSLPPPLLDIAVDGPAAEVFRLSPEEPWRVIRTQWRVAGKVSGPIEGGGRASGYFTSATGITIYRGDAFPEDYVGDAFIADVGSNLIHRKKLRGDGVALIAERPADEQKTEFIASRDLWFRPVQFANAPDGTLYFADMYREVVEHPWSIPESIKKHLDLNSGNDRGRIYRIVPEGFRQPKQRSFSDASTAQLVAALEHNNGWHRDTAARLLYQRQDKAAVPLLEKLLEENTRQVDKDAGARSPDKVGDKAGDKAGEKVLRGSWGRLHALYALSGLGALRSSHLGQAISDRDPHVRAHAIRLAEPRFLNDPEFLDRAVKSAARDPSAVVRYQAALSQGEGNDVASENFAAIAPMKPGDPWVDSALLQSLSSGAAELFITFAKAATKSRPSANFMRQLAQLAGAQDRSGVSAVANTIAALSDSARACELAAALAEGLGANLPTDVRDRLKPVFQKARELAVSAKADEQDRTSAITLLGFADSGAEEQLVALLNASEPPRIQSAALAALDRYEKDVVARTVLGRWTILSPRLRGEGIAILLKRPDRAVKLLESIQGGIVQTAEMSSTQASFLRTHRDRRVRDLAVRVLPPVHTGGYGKRDDVVQSLQPAVTRRGDAARGKSIYLERCSSCHRLRGEGYQLGPDLETVKTTGREKLLINIVDPNREVPANYVSYVVETKNGDSFMGLIVNETATSIVVRQPYGKEDIVPRSQIARMQSQGQSLMPEGLEAGLAMEAMADLLEYLERN